MTDYEGGMVLRRLEREKDGKKINIKIQKVTPDLHQTIIDHMIKFFAPRKPMGSYLGMMSDPESQRDQCKLWRLALQDGAALVALLDQPGPPQLVATNITYISTRGKKDLEFKGEGRVFNTIMTCVDSITKEGDLYERYGVDKYLSAMGLSVDSEYHGLGLGEALLQAREPLCKLLGIRMTATVFTAPASQHLARKVGFKDIVIKRFADWEVQGSIPFHSMKGDVALMAKMYK